ncbi:LptF/LptG family permease [Bernardetia sp. MNP-M8]|uniref:LptF/LptG family permease n=1 Tax=Bernardetia sp. MNP-M8 TaxID=3127470 RepID=UPI0030D58AB4
MDSKNQTTRVKILDKYILKKFLTTYVFVVLVILAVICAIDYSEKSDDFIKHSLTFKQIVVEYYSNFIMHIIGLITPLMVFITTVFVTSRMAGRTEIIAMLSGGMSYLRLFVPYMIGASIIAIFSFYLNGWVIPRANKIKIAFETAYVKKPFSFDERNVHSKIDSNTYVYLQSYNNNTFNGRKFTIERIENRKLVEKLSAENITWDTLKQTWHIDDYKIHTFFAERELILRGKDMDTLMGLLPKDFESKYRYNETLTLPEIDEYIAEQKARGTALELGIYYVEKYQRYASPFAIIILTLMGVVVSSKKTRQGTSFNIALGFVLAFVFILFVVVARSLGQSGALDPRVGAWIPNIIFGIVAIYLYWRAPK